MTDPLLATQVRAGIVERAHYGRVAIVDGRGDLVFAAGDVAAPMLPRSSCKILQAMPLVESGAADAHRLTPRHLALACASHQGSAAHALLSETWLGEMGLGEPDLMCGSHAPIDEDHAYKLRTEGEAPTQLHNNCSGKHTGFLCLAQHLGAPTEGYIDTAHPVQTAVKEATEDLAGEESPSFAIDGCSAPNFALSLTGLARAMAKIAAAETALPGVRADAAIKLRSAMAQHPFEVAGDGRACTELMQAGEGRFAMKTGAEGSYTAIIPELGFGVALKINDGRSEAAECAIAAILVALGLLNANDPRVAGRLAPQLLNRRNVVCGETRATELLTSLTLN